MPFDELSEVQKNLLLAFKPNPETSRSISNPLYLRTSAPTSFLLDMVEEFSRDNNSYFHDGKNIYEEQQELLKEYNDYEILQTCTEGAFKPLLEHNLITKVESQVSDYLEEGTEETVFKLTPEGIEQVHREIEEYEYVVTGSVSANKNVVGEIVTGVPEASRDVSANSVRIPPYVPHNTLISNAGGCTIRSPSEKRFVLHEYPAHKTQDRDQRPVYEALGVVEKGANDVFASLEHRTF